MTDISTLVGGPDRAHRTSGGQRARVVKPPASLGAPLTVSLLAYTNDYEYEVPATNWVSRGTALPVKGTVGAAVFDDFGDVWFLVGGGTEFPVGGGGAETDPIASAALTAHAADTTAIHGIADTSLLVVTSDPRLTNARTPTAHHTTHEPGGTDPMAVDAAAATGSLRTLGTGAAQAAPGNDARLSDQRVPTDGSVTNAKVAGAAAIAESKLSLASDAAAGTASRRTLGTGAAQAAAGNDARFTDARTPTAHKTSHESGGSDVLTGNLDAVGRSNVKKAGTTIGTRRGLNLIEGANITLTVADDAANEEVDVTIAAAAGGGTVFYDDLQQGVVGAGDCALTVNTTAQVTIAAGTIYVTVSGALTRAAPGSTVLGSIPAASAANFRLDQVVVSSTGTVSRLAGTQGTTVTLANRTGAAAVPAGSLLLHDILVSSSGVTAANVRDRRARARGAKAEVVYTAGNQSVTSTTLAAITTISTAVQQRIECSGAQVMVEVSVRLNSPAAAGHYITILPAVDGAVASGVGTDDLTVFSQTATGTLETRTRRFRFTPTAGSHLITIFAKVTTGTGTVVASAAEPLRLTIEEDIRPIANNGTT